MTQENILKPTDLMIGDWVMYNPNVFIEDEYEPTKECYPTQIQNGEDIDLAIERCYSPIPLTPEILEKNGFTNDGYAILELDTHSILQYYFHEHRLRKIWTGIDEWDNHSEVTDISFQCTCHYIHELQHALNLCGIEKEIAL